MAISVSSKKIKINNLDGQDFIDKYGFKCPLGVKGRNSHNKLFKEKVGWEVSQKLNDGIKSTYKWIENQVQKNKK